MNFTDIKGLGQKSLLALEQENINSIDDLLITYPSSYDIYELNEEKAFSGEFTCVKTVLDTKAAFIKYRPNVYSIIFYCYIQSYRMKCILFSSDYLRYKLFKGVNVVLYGKYKKENNEFLVRRIFFDDFQNKIDVNYKLKTIKAYQMQRFVREIEHMGYRVPETLPLSLLDKYKLIDKTSEIYLSHLPSSREDIRQVMRRRKYEEFFWYAMSFHLLKQERYRREKDKRNLNLELLRSYIRGLSFKLTSGQMDAVGDVIRDIESPYPMNRLVQGDVGCGKSIVSVIAALALATASYQATVMLPTELLAIQQYSLFSKEASLFGLQTRLLTSSTPKKEKKEILEDVKKGVISILVGTHALLEDTVEFHHLGIAIIDEQHKFGVNQRRKLVEKYPDVDALYLTATPIPRTLGLTVFGDLDISSIHTMPSGRIPIDTKIITYHQFPGLAKFIRNHIEAKEQVYVVVPLVTENEDYDAISIKEAEEMFHEALPEASIGVVHGKMAAEKKKAAMEDFKNGITSILVSTTVIEVGVNVPSATIMVLMDADRFGLAQIHQLRGRVGRGSQASYCALVTKKPENERLKALEVLADGFGIADEDFKQRGPGNYFGEEQSGYIGLECADFEADFKIWECARKDAEEYLPRFLNHEVESKRFTELFLENEKNGKKSA